MRPVIIVVLLLAVLHNSSAQKTTLFSWGTCGGMPELTYSQFVDVASKHTSASPHPATCRLAELPLWHFEL